MNKLIKWIIVDTDKVLGAVEDAQIGTLIAKEITQGGLEQFKKVNEKMWVSLNSLKDSDHFWTPLFNEDMFKALSGPGPVYMSKDLVIER